MKQFIKTSFIALLLANGATYALNPVQGWYGGVLIGVNYAPSANFNIPTAIPPINVPGALNYGTMGAIGGQLGYRFGKYRLEGQYFYNNNPYKSLELGDITLFAPSTSPDFRIEGSTDSGLGMLNGFYDFLPSDPRSSIVPYLGVGLGYAYFSNNLTIYHNNVNLYAAHVKEATTSPAGQAIVGMSYFLDDFASFSLDFRYLTTSGKSKFLDSRLQVYTLNLSFNGAFNFA